MLLNDIFKCYYIVGELRLLCWWFGLIRRVGGFGLFWRVGGFGLVRWVGGFGFFDFVGLLVGFAMVGVVGLIWMGWVGGI